CNADASGFPCRGIHALQERQTGGSHRGRGAVREVAAKPEAADAPLPRSRNRPDEGSPPNRGRGRDERLEESPAYLPWALRDLHGREAAIREGHRDVLEARPRSRNGRAGHRRQGLLGEGATTMIQQTL